MFKYMNFNHFCSRTNININDVLGDYALTLVDSLDTLAVSISVDLSLVLKYLNSFQKKGPERWLMNWWML